MLLKSKFFLNPILSNFAGNCSPTFTVSIISSVSAPLSLAVALHDDE
jgi:hypothetical protein